MSPTTNPDVVAHDKENLPEIPDSNLNGSESSESVRASQFSSPDAPTTSSFSSIGSSSHDPSPLEARHYYCFGYGSHSPKLVFRTSKDVWEPPTAGPWMYPREMQLCNIPGDHELAQNPGLWDPLRDQVVELLKAQSCQFSSVELISFTWLEKDDGDDDEEDNNEPGDLDAEFNGMPSVKAVEGERYTTPPTIWVGVLPATLSSAAACDLATEILGFVSQYNLTGVDVAFRESEAQLLSTGAPLFAPVNNYDHRKSVIDDLSTVLPLPIAGIETSMQGTLTCFFRVGKELYAITARHILFKDGKDDEEYTFKESMPRKDVIVMGPKAFEDYQTSIEDKITNIEKTILYLAKCEKALKRKVEDNTDDTDSAIELEKTCQQRTQYNAQMSALKAFHSNVRKHWGKVNNRIIGHVVWAPKIDINTSPYGYTRDFCVIHIDKKRFEQGFRGNTLSLGPETTPTDFTNFMFDQNNAPFEFAYPPQGLLEVKGILTAHEINTPKNVVGGLVHRVFKRGTATKTTIGTVLPFKAHVRHYLALVPRDSIELAIISHRNVPRPFSRGGDSGALIVNAHAKFVALLTGGSGITDSLDVSYGTPFEWIWELVEAKFLGADLCFGDINEFFKDED